MTVQIPLSRGFVALVDDADAEAVLAFGKWHARTPRAGKTYARRNVWDRSGDSPRCTTYLMHQFITGWDYVDHVNGDGLDNRRSNLRPATARQNQGNVGLRRDNKTGYKGVKHHRGRYRADCAKQYLGIFPTAEAAARAYDEAAVVAFGEFARLNFPKETAA